MIGDSSVGSPLKDRLTSLLERERARYQAALSVISGLVTPSLLWAAVREAGVPLSPLVRDGSTSSFLRLLDNLPARPLGGILWILNKRIASPSTRRDIADALALLDPTMYEPSESSFPETGLVRIPPLLTSVEVRELTDFLRSRSETLQDGPTHANRVEDVLFAPHALKIATHPEVLRIASSFLGCSPTIADISAWRTDPAVGEDYPAHIFHRDRDDFRACKLFLYLSDVGDSSGPHVFVQGTHDQVFVRNAIVSAGLSEERVVDFFSGNGREMSSLVAEIFRANIVEITGAAGTGFIEATYGFHRGSPVLSGSRLLLQVLYANILYPTRCQGLSSAILPTVPVDCVDNVSTRVALRAFLPF